MSDPYVYQPPAFEPTPYLHSYYNQPYRSPFIPPATLFTSTPHHSPNAGYAALPGVHYDDNYWNNPHPRARRPSWHAGMVHNPPSPSFLSIPLTPNHNHHRRHSYGQHDYAPWPDVATGSPWGYRPTSPHFQIHPALNGEAPRSDFYFDLSASSFAPMRWFGPGRSAVISTEELRQPATHPAISCMRITHPSIPKWPIDLEYNYQDSGSQYYSATPLPITLGDVLYAIHYALHKQITHRDWAELSLSEETAIARAYTRRCKSVPSTSQLEASQGVKRVDFLHDRFMFKGLVRAQDEDGFYHWKMIT